MKNLFKLFIIALLLLTLTTNLSVTGATKLEYVKTFKMYGCLCKGSTQHNYIKPYENGILFTLVHQEHLFSNKSITLYYANTASIVKLFTIHEDCPFCENIPIIDVYNDSLAVVSLIHGPLRHVVSGNFTQVKSTVLVLNGLKIVSSKSFDNLTFGVLGKDGLMYVSYDKNESVLITPNKVYEFKNEAIVDVWCTKCGTLVLSLLESPGSLFSLFFGGKKVSRLTLLCKWNVTIEGETLANVIGDYIIVYNSRYYYPFNWLLLFNLSNGKLVYSYSPNSSISCPKIYYVPAPLKHHLEVLVINNTLHTVMGPGYVILNMNTMRVEKIAEIHEWFACNLQFINNTYVLIYGGDKFEIWYINGTMYINGSTVSPDHDEIVLCCVIYSNGYIYKMGYSKSQYLTIPKLFEMQVFSFGGPVSISSSTQTSTSTTTSSTSTPSSTTSTTQSVTSSTSTQTETRSSTSIATTSSEVTTLLPTQTTTSSSSGVPIYVVIVALALVAVVILSVIILRKR